MYEELVQRLRSHNGWALNETLDDAADAIEELSKRADAIPHVCECCVGCELEKKNGGCDNAFILSPKRAMQYLIKPRWIPATERLPDCFYGEEIGNVEWISHGTVYAGCFGRGGKFRDAYFRVWNDDTECIDAMDAEYWRFVLLPQQPKEKT